jgi:UDP-glucuronate decarboxylase
MDYRRQHHVSVKIARIFNTYGPRMHPGDGRVISNFICQALEGRPLTVYGDGTQTRSFCYVDDLIDALIRLMASPDAFTGPVNLGNPHEVSMLDAARRIVELTHSRSRIVFEPLPIDDPWHRRPDISLAQRTLGWQPHTGFDDGLARTARYLGERLTLAAPHSSTEIDSS